MQREIKFRAWDERNKEMHYPKDATENFGHGAIGSAHLLKHYSIVMQYTGLKDEDGKEIYDGDIVDYGYKKSVVVWYDAAWYSAGVTEKCCEEIHSGKNPYTVYMEGGHCVEMDSVRAHSPYSQPTVIGNIYENPDLLKK